MKSAFVVTVIISICLDVTSADFSADSCCDGCYSCVNSTEVQTCISTGCEDASGQAFKLTGNATLFGYKGENITFTLMLDDANATNVNVTIHKQNETKTTLPWPINGDFEYTVTNATKTKEGMYHFLASGEVKNGTLKSKISTNLYVFTVNVHTEKDRYVLISGKTEEIKITVTSDTTDWSRIELHGTLPHSTEDRKDLLEITVDSQIREHHTQILTPAKHNSEGEYRYKATEYSLTIPKQQYSATTTIEVYVHSTILEAESAFFTSELNGTVNMLFTVTTELKTWDNITIHVVKPNNVIETLDITEISGAEANISFILSNMQMTDFGEYKFVAVEHTEDFGNTTYSLSSYVYGRITVLSDLQMRNGTYISLVGAVGSVTCSIDGAADATWWGENSEVSKNENGDIFQSGNGILNIANDADFSEALSFTCKGGGQEKSLMIAVEGLLKVIVTPVLGGGFICTSQGNPRPSIMWKLGNTSSLPPDIFGDTTDGFQGSFESNSTLEVNGSPLCLADQKLACIASNLHGNSSDEITVNEGFVDAYMYKYIVFSKYKANFFSSNSTCEGNLVMVKDASKEAFLTKQAEAANITEFYIGAVVNETGSYVWPDGTPVSYLDLTEQDQKNCSGYKFLNDGWTFMSINCTRDAHFVCEYIDEHSPKGLDLTAAECNSSIIQATWKAPAGLKQLVSIQNANDPAKHEEELPAGASSKVFDSLSEETEYKVKVSAIRNYCSLLTYVEASANTVGPPMRPISAQVEEVENNAVCKLAWTYTDEKPGRFWVEVTVQAVVDESNEFVPEKKVHEVAGSATSVNTTMYPNSMYTAKIWAENCVGNGSYSTSNAGCQTTVAAAPVVSHPAWYTTKDNTIRTTLPEADNRAGPISCQFLVVRLGEDSKNGSLVMDDDRFLKIKQSDAGEIKTNEEYFAFATTALNQTLDIYLGDDSRTSCAPLPARTSKTKRAIQKDDEFSAWNRPLPFDVKVTYFMVTSTPNEEKTAVYFGMSQASTAYYIHQNPSSSPSASVIVLSVLATVVIICLGVFLYWRWRQRSKRSHIRRSFRLSYKADTSDYDAL